MKFFYLTILCLFFLTSVADATFTVELDLTSVDFAVMKPGEIKGDLPIQGITVTCTTNQGNPWFLRTHLENPLTHISNPFATISSENFFWYGYSTTGSGMLVTDEQDFTEEKIIYTASAGEGTSGVDVKVRFKLRIPENAQAGQYDTRIVLTLIEQ